MTDVQAQFYALAQDAVAYAEVCGAVTVGLLAVIAIRALWSR